MTKFPQSAKSDTKAARMNNNLYLNFGDAIRYEFTQLNWAKVQNYYDLRKLTTMSTIESAT